MDDDHRNVLRLPKRLQDTGFAVDLLTFEETRRATSDGAGRGKSSGKRRVPDDDRIGLAVTAEFACFCSVP
jgi:hypothetical protein